MTALILIAIVVLCVIVLKFIIDRATHKNERQCWNCRDYCQYTNICVPALKYRDPHDSCFNWKRDGTRTETED